MWIDRRTATIVTAIGAIYGGALSHETSASARCAALVEDQRFDDAVGVCADAYARGGAVDDALAETHALHELGRDDEAIDALARLRGTSRGTEALRRMSAIHLAHDRFEVAQALLGTALALDQASRDNAGAYADAHALVQAYWARNEFGEALRVAMVARQVAEASGDRKLHGASLVALGAVLQTSGDREQALDAYTQATSVLPRDDIAGRANALLNLGALLDEQRHYAMARPKLEEARELAIRAGDLRLVLGAEENLADNALSLRDLDAAERHLDGAEFASFLRDGGMPSHGILINRAVVARHRGDLAGALRALDAAAAGGPPPDAAWLIAHEHGLVAEARGDIHAAEHDYRAAMEIIDKLWLSSSPEELKAPFFEDRWLPYQSLFALQLAQHAPAAAFEAVTRAQGRMFVNAAVAAATGTGDAAARFERLRALAPLMNASLLASSLGSIETLTALADRYALDYFAANGKMHLLILDRGRVRIASVDIELPRLEQLIDDFLTHPDEPAAAAALGEALLPRDALAAAPTRFHIIPDGPLLRVPFAALVAGGTRVVDSHEVVYAPSATALARLESSAPAATTRPVVLGDPSSNLPHAADDIAAAKDATHAELWQGLLATIARLRSAQNASLLHIAGHSGVGPRGGYLVLSDGDATASDILAWRIHPRLVVLPTCASAAARRRDMWGSLATAFLAAGSRDVVATLHTVSDHIAGEFTQAFYRHHGDRDPVAATAAAQRDLAAREPASAWSTFLVVGL